jgi:hypothetical protein
MSSIVPASESVEALGGKELALVECPQGEESPQTELHFKKAAGCTTGDESCNRGKG